MRIGEENNDGKIRILSGLIGNEEVVISAQFMLDSESRLQEAIQKMLTEKKESKAKSMEQEKSVPETGEDSIDKDKHKMQEPEKEKTKESEMKCGAGKCGGNM